MQLRSEAEIFAKAKEVMETDMFGWNVPDYLKYLPFEMVREYLNDDVTKEDWDKDRTKYYLGGVLKEMQDYLEFAIGKAEDERGISANRSLDHYQNWFWLIGMDEMSEHIWDDYCAYGLPKLREIEQWLKDHFIS